MSRAIASAGVERQHRQILAEIDELVRLSGREEPWDTWAPEVSQWNVGQQVEHLAQSDRMILQGCDAALDGTLESAGGRPTLAGWFILLTGSIPRGKGKAPDGTRPEGLDRESVVSSLLRVRGEFEALAPRLGELEAADWTYKHPVMGALTGVRWLRFVSIHHRHHQKIIDEILASGN